MGIEIERKFLLQGEGWRGLGQSTLLRQGYLSSHKDRTVRVRIAGEAAFLTIKSANVGARRGEWEYPIPVAEAAEQLVVDWGPVVGVRTRIRRARLRPTRCRRVVDARSGEPDRAPHPARAHGHVRAAHPGGDQHVQHVPETAMDQVQPAREAGGQVCIKGNHLFYHGFSAFIP